MHLVIENSEQLLSFVAKVASKINVITDEATSKQRLCPSLISLAGAFLSSADAVFAGAAGMASTARAVASKINVGSVLPSAQSAGVTEASAKARVMHHDFAATFY